MKFFLKSVIYIIILQQSNLVSTFMSILNTGRHFNCTSPIVIEVGQIISDFLNFRQLKSTLVQNHFIVSWCCCSLVYFLRNHEKISTFIKHDIILHYKSTLRIFYSPIVIFNSESVIYSLSNNYETQAWRVVVFAFELLLYCFYFNIDNHLLLVVSNSVSIKQYLIYIGIFVLYILYMF